MFVETLKRIKQWVSEWPWFIVALAVVLVLVAVMWLWHIIGAVAGVGIFSSLIGLLLAPFALGSLFISLRAADRIGGIKWKVFRDKIIEESLPAAIYASSRWIAGAIIISAAMR